ncbi:MAG: toll/interleukin-1 receptor domain-containing protein [Nitrososphaera sp.]
MLQVGQIGRACSLQIQVEHYNEKFNCWISKLEALSHRSIRLGVLWKIYFPSDSISDQFPPALYLNYMPQIELKQLRELFYEPDAPSLAIDGSLMDEVLSLIAEIKGLIQPVAIEQVEGIEIKVNSEKLSIRHDVTPTWFGYNPDVSNVLWHRDSFVAMHSYKGDDGRIPLTRLSNSARATISKLDEIALEEAYRRYLADLKRISESHNITGPPLTKVKVFISYRMPHLEQAKRLHSILQNYGYGAYFDPYLDAHDLGLGHLLQALLKQIRSSHVFMPLVTDDFASNGSISKGEYDEAQSLHESEMIEIAPIFLGKPDTPISNELEPLKHHRDDGSLTDSNKELMDYLRVVHQSGLRLLSRQAV